MKLFLAAIAAVCLFAVPSFAQTPSQSTVNFNIGAGALGLGGSSQATPATDVVVQIDPGFSKLKGFSFRDDNVLAPGAGFQLYAPGGDYTLPHFFKTGLFASVTFHVNASAGIARVVPSSGPSTSGIGVMAGGSIHWLSSKGIDVDMLDAGYMKTPGVFGGQTVYLGGQLSYVFGGKPAPTQTASYRYSISPENFTPTW